MRSIDHSEQLIGHGEAANVDCRDLYHLRGDVSAACIDGGRAFEFEAEAFGQAGGHQVAGAGIEDGVERTLTVDGGFELNAVFRVYGHGAGSGGGWRSGWLNSERERIALSRKTGGAPSLRMQRALPEV